MSAEWEAARPTARKDAPESSNAAKLAFGGREDKRPHTCYARATRASAMCSLLAGEILTLVDEFRRLRTLRRSRR